MADLMSNPESELSLDDLFDMTDVTVVSEPTDIPSEWDLTTIVMRNQFWLTCRVRDGGAGAPITISY